MIQTAHCSIRIDSRRGSALVLMAAVLFASLGIAAYAINTVYMETVRTELQIATDVTARAACKEFVMTENADLALQKAREIAAGNQVANQMLQLADEDLSFQTAVRREQSDAYEYSAKDSSPNAVFFNADFFARSMEGIEPLMPVVGAPPFRPVKQAIAIQAELDLAIVLDCSTSMLSTLEDQTGIELPVSIPLAAPGENSRWAIAKDGILELLDQCQNTVHNEAVGVTFFGTLALQGAQLTDRYEDVEVALSVNETVYLGGTTNVGDGILSGVGLLSNENTARPWASRVILLISDGLRNTGPAVMDAAIEASDEYISIYTISISDEADQGLMEEIADVTNGQHFHAEQPSDISSVLSYISDRLPILISK